MHRLLVTTLDSVTAHNDDSALKVNLYILFHLMTAYLAWLVKIPSRCFATFLIALCECEYDFLSAYGSYICVLPSILTALSLMYQIDYLNISQDSRRCFCSALLSFGDSSFPRYQQSTLPLSFFSQPMLCLKSIKPWVHTFGFGTSFFV